MREASGAALGDLVDELPKPQDSGLTVVNRSGSCRGRKLCFRPLQANPTACQRGQGPPQAASEAEFTLEAADGPWIVFPRFFEFGNNLRHCHGDKKAYLAARIYIASRAANRIRKV